MRRLLIVSHGPLARGMLETLELFNGKDSCVQAVCGYMDDSPFQDSIAAFIASLKQEEELIIVADLASGSVAQACLGYMARPHTHLLGGMNLSLLLGLLTFKRSDYLTGEDVGSLVAEAREEIKYLNHWRMVHSEEDEL